MIFPLLFLGAFAISFLLPLHYYPWASFYLEFSAFLALFIAAAGLALCRGSLRAPRVYLVFFGFAAVALAQAMLGLSLFRGDGILSFFYVSAFALALVVSRLYATTDTGQKVADSIALALVAIGIVSVWVALIQWLQLGVSQWVYAFPQGGRPYANLGQTNNYSSLVWLALFSLYYLFERKRIGLLGMVLAGAFLIFGAALAQSRTSWVVFSVLLCVVLVHGGLFRYWRWQRLALPLLVMAAFYIFSLAALELKGFLFGLGDQELRVMGLKDVRIDMWISFFHAIKEAPWFGYGWGQVSVAQLAVADMYPAVGLTQYSHNLFLDLLIWNGIPLGLLFFALISYLWLRIFFYAYTTKGFYSLCCFTVLLVHSLLEYPHAYSYFLLLAGFFIGISGAEPIDSSQFRSSRWLKMPLLATVDGWLAREYKIPKYVLVPVIIIFAAALVVSWQDYRVLEEDHRLLRFENASIGTLKADQKAPDVLLFDQLQSFTWVARTKSFDGLTENEQRLIEKVATRYPLPMPLLKLAKLRVVQGRPDSAANELRVIEHLHGEQVYKAAEQSLRQFIEDRDGVAGASAKPVARQITSYPAPQSTASHSRLPHPSAH